MYNSCDCSFSLYLWDVTLSELALGYSCFGCRTDIFTFGFALILSTLNLFFRDLERFVALGIMLMFYCTPILYNSDMIPKQFSWIIDYNPLASLILAWRDLLKNGNLDYMHITYLYSSGIVILMLGVWVFNKLKYRFAEIL